MTDSMLNVRHYAKTGITGGTENDLDGIDVSAAEFSVGSVCRVYKSVDDVRSVLFYKAEASSGTADGTNIVIPVIPVAYSGTIRWHLYGTSGGGSSLFSMPFFTCENGLSNEEIFRWVLQAGETLTVSRVELPIKGGGTNANVSIDVYDSTTARVLASTTAGAINATPLTSGAGSTVLLRLSNASGNTVNVGFAIEYEVR